MSEFIHKGTQIDDKHEGAFPRKVFPKIVSSKQLLPVTY